MSHEITYMWNIKKKKKMVQMNRSRIIDVENKLMVTKGEGSR